MKKGCLGCTFYILVFLSAILTFNLVSCKKDPVFPLKPAGKKIKQSFTIHDDNVNGIVLRKADNITVREITNFYYNSNGLLDSLDAFDSTYTVMFKSLKLEYMPSISKIRGYFFDYNGGRYTLDFYYNENHELIKVTDVVGLGWGIFLDYSYSKITQGTLVLGSTIGLSNFVYDGSNNLIQYVVNDTLGDPFLKVQIDYDYSKLIPEENDIRFAGVGLRYLYAGGVNVISLMGLSYGSGNTNRVTNRTESNILTGEITRTFKEFYTTNSDDDIIEKRIVVNDSIDVIYDYYY